MKITGLKIEGGGLSNYSHNGCGLRITDYQSNNITGSIIRGNQSYFGGGVYAYNTDSVMIHNSIIRNNFVLEGGGGVVASGTGNYFIISNKKGTASLL